MVLDDGSGNVPLVKRIARRLQSLLPPAFLWTGGWLYYKIRKREGLGLGDVKLIAMVGGTPNLIGTRILSGLRPTGQGSFKGQAFDPKHNIRAPATVRLVGPDAIEVRGCAIAGMFICKEQRWTRVS